MHITLATRVGFANGDHRIIALAGIIDTDAKQVQVTPSTHFDQLRLEVRHSNGAISSVVELPSACTVEQGIETIDTFAKVSFIR